MPEMQEQFSAWLDRPIAALQTRNKSMLHNTRLIDYTSDTILRSNAALVRSTRGLLA